MNEDEKKKNPLDNPAVDAYTRRRGVDALVEAAMVGAAGGVSGGYEDPYKDQYAVTLPKSYDIDYTHSNADRAIKDYQDKELVNVVGSLAPAKVGAPAIHEDVPVIDTTLEYEAPTEEMKEFEEEKRKANAYQFLHDYADSLYSKTDREKDEKKKKAAQWILAAQMLGDSIGALGNVYWTGKGANAQKVEPGAQKAAEATYALHQDIKNAQEKAAKAKLDATLKQFELEYRDKQAKQAQDNADRAYDLQLKQFNANEAHRAQQQANWEKQQAEEAERWNKTFNINKKKTEQELVKLRKENKPFKFDVGDGYVDIPKEYINEQSIGAIFQMLPDEIKEKSGTPKYGKDMMGNTVLVGYGNPSLADMLTAIGMGVDDANVANALKSLAKGEKVADNTDPNGGAGNNKDGERIVVNY